MRDSLTYRFMLYTTIIIVLIMGINFVWDYRLQKKQALIEMREKAQVITKQLVATREFIAKNQDRINYDSQGNFEFKHLNPAAVGMGVSGIFGELTDYRIKQTRIDCRDETNNPDDFEFEVLNTFQDNPMLKEIWTEGELDGKPVFRYMIPLRIKDECLACHGGPPGEIDVTGYPKEGYKVGDLGGAISLVMPMEIFLSNIQTSVFRHLGFILLLIAAILSSMYFLVTRLVLNSLGKLESAVAKIGDGNLDVDLSGINAQGEIRSLAENFNVMASQLKDLYENLEHKVEQRTQELEAANQELEQANIKLNEINRYKSEFLAIMSHELRTPLTSIMAFTELLQNDMPPEFTVELQNLQEIRNHSENLLRLINNILDLARIEAGRQQLNLEIVDISDVILSVESVMTPLAKKKEIRLVTEIASDIPLITADAEKIRRVVENLAGNALKFTPPKGEVRITTTYDSKDQQICIVVQDTGIGIRKEEQALIFERFTQLDSSNSRKYGGTGLGLALAKELVEMHQGSIQVESELDQGSTFMVCVPIHQNVGEGGDS